MNNMIINRETFDRFYTAFPTPGGELHYKLEYPKKTHEAITEMLERGININQKLLSYYITKGHLPQEKKGKEYLWSKEQVDNAIEFFASNRLYNPEAYACEALNIDHSQFKMAFLEACSEVGANAIEYADPWEAVITITPATPTNFSKTGTVKMVIDKEKFQDRIIG